MTDELKQAIARAEAAEAERNKLMRMLERLTPGGSEFHDDPERCVEWIQSSIHLSAKHIIERKRAEAEAEGLREALERILELPLADGVWADAHEIARAALEGGEDE